jgi:nucleotide-binding universal stress UspA family protein
MTIVVGYTPNEYGDIALAHGIDQAKKRGSALVVLNATRGDSYVDNRFATKDQLADLDVELSSAGVEYDVRQSMGSDVPEQVLNVVDEVKAELLVIGIRHRSAVGKMLMGSVAQRLLLDSPAPVLAVKPGQEP